MQYYNKYFYILCERIFVYTFRFGYSRELKREASSVSRIVHELRVMICTNSTYIYVTLYNLTYNVKTHIKYYET